MSHRPPTEGLSRATRLLAAVVIAIAALGITWMANRCMGSPPEPTIPLPPR